jgi:hypothetical protein
MKILNYTPHEVICAGRKYPSAGVARVACRNEPFRTVDGIDFVRQEFGQIEGLPDASLDTVYIVSVLVKAAAADRSDLVSPGDLVRDGEGRVVGCKNLAV